MSRARSITFNGQRHWFDSQAAHSKATVEQLELLAAAENLQIDDLLDEGLTQAGVIERLRVALDQGVIPAEVLERRRARREFEKQERVCRICTTLDQNCDGGITRHHFVPRWLMRELENYQSYAHRRKCTIPVCMGRHRDLHMRSEEDKSIVQFLNDNERKFAQKMLTELKEQHPRIFDLMDAGNPEVSYEAQLIKDFREGNFVRESMHREINFAGSRTEAYAQQVSS